MVNTGDTGRMLRRLLQDAHLVTLEQLPGLIAERAGAAGLYDVAVFAVDLRETLLRQITGRGLDAAAGGEELGIDGTLPGRAYQRVTIVAEPRARNAPGAGGGCR